jgi:putative exporter of polyketide antibiotics
MSPRTAFLSKLIGLYCLFMALAMTPHKEATVAKVAALAQDPPVLLILGVFTLVAGLAMVLGHNVWRGGGGTVVVTLVGWLALLKGLLFLFLPPGTYARFLLEQAHYERLFYFYMALIFVIGVYLTYGGFAASPKNVPRDS